MLFTVHGPFDVINGSSSCLTTQSSDVLSVGCTFSHIFFFGLSCFSGSSSWPAQITRSPIGTPSGGSTSSMESTPLPHKTIACDSTPFSFVGFMLATTTTRRLAISSIGTYLTRPETTCRVR